MSNRFPDYIYKRSREDAQVLKAAERKNKRLSKAHGSNLFRISDIEKTIHGRRSGQRSANSLTWATKYFRAAVSHLIARRKRTPHPTASLIEQIQEWVITHVPVLRIERGEAWIEAEIRKTHAKGDRRACPRIDRTNRLLEIQDDEREKYGLRSLSAVSRPRAVREEEDRQRRAQAEQDRRAKVEGHTPRSESNAAKIRAAGDKPNTIKSRNRRARLAAEKAAKQAMHPVSCPDLDGVHPVSCPTIAETGCTLFRALQLDTPEARPATPVECSPDLAATLDAWKVLRALPTTAAEIEGKAKVEAWHAYLEATRASTVYGKARAA